MDPYHNQRDSRDHLNPRRNQTNPPNSTAGGSENETPDNQNRDAPDGGNPPPTDRQPQHSGGYTVFPPNQSRRSKLTTMAQKEEEALQRWKEENRPPPVHLNPEKLGGNATLAGARDKQLADLRCSKLQKRLKKEEMDRKRRQEEEEELQRKKDEQREKSERLEERKRQEEQRRREQYSEDHFRATQRFLQGLERSAPGPSSSATHTSSRTEAVESKPRELRSVRDVQLDHRRVNTAFLDRLEGLSRGRETGEGDPSSASEDFRLFNTPGQQQLPPVHLDPDPEQRCSNWTEEADPEPDYDWALMKLESSFPDCCRVFLEDILNQCSGDYEQAYTLLISTLS